MEAWKKALNKILIPIYFYNFLVYILIIYILMDNCWVYLLISKVEGWTNVLSFYIYNPFLDTNYLTFATILTCLPQNLHDTLIGNMLGDGHLRKQFTPLQKKDQLGRPQTNRNAYYSMTSKSYEYIMHLWSKYYFTICTKNLPRPWPNPKTGLPVKQYTFQTKSYPELSYLHKLWYRWSDELKKYIKIVPINICDLLTPIGLAYWIMDDGYKSDNGVVLCTDSFTLDEVNLLVSVLKDNFDLIATINRKAKKGKLIGWRIRISGESENRDKLLSIVKPYFIPCMFYKLNI